MNMNKKLWMIVLSFLLPLSMMADSYQSLWRQFTDAQHKDLPATQLNILKQIASKSEKDHNYGQLLSAELKAASLKSNISPDSLSAEVGRLKSKAQKAEPSDPVLAAIYESALGRFYAENPNLGDDHVTQSKKYYQLSMQHPDLLAKQKTSEFTPLFIKGTDSAIFNNDLLHVIGLQAKDYKTLLDYYQHAGNRAASCIIACKQLDANQKVGVLDTCKSQYLHRLDSLIQVYRDIPETGELALARYRFLQRVKSVTVADRIHYIDYALSQWGNWQGMDFLRNEKKELTNPSFSASLQRVVIIPNQSFQVKVDLIRHLPSLSLSIRKINIGVGQLSTLLGTRGLTTLNEAQYKTLKGYLSDEVLATQKKSYGMRQPYEILKDSFEVKGLPVGIYLVEMTSGDKDIATQRAFFFVSDVALLHEELPEGKVRYAVVSATTGQPLQNATLRLTLSGNAVVSHSGSSDYSKATTLKCDDKGEVICPYTQQNSVIYVSTPSDSCCPEMNVWGNYSYYAPRQESENVNLFTDRKIYRPGQTVHVAAIDYTIKEGVKAKAASGKKIQLVLRNANGKSVAEAEVSTDEYGTASTSFSLPANGLTGRFSVYADNHQGAVSSTYFNVEEYKRPTFQVTFPETNQIYHAGDTVTVKATAKNYTGVPVQGARVKYEVVRRPAIWWRLFGLDEAQKSVYTDTAVTDDKGEFIVRVPMVIDNPGDDAARFYHFEVNASVTDAGGETESGTLTLPLGTRATAFSCDLPEKAEIDSLKSIVFQYRNAAGTAIPATVNYRFDNGTESTAKANESVTLKGLSNLSSGRHILWAVCGTDTLKQSVVLFKMTDKTPVVDTRDWFYQSSKTFSEKGQPVYVQVGSSDPDQHILYAIFSGNKILESGTIDQTKALYTRAFTYRPEYGDGILLTYAWMKNGVAYIHTTTIEAPLPDKRLKLNWSTFRNMLTPGQKETWTLKITRPDGTPASAQLLSVLYDKSLDQILQHNWNFSLDLSRSLPSTSWQAAQSRFSWLNLNGNASYQTLKTSPLAFTTFDPTYFDTGNAMIFPGVGPVGIQMRAAVTDSGKMPMALAEKKLVSTNGLENLSESDDRTASPHSATGGLRENKNETAFFYPALTTDSKGNVVLKFTLPESVTTWRFMALAHDKDMNFGSLSDEVIARKTVMIQPNMPRFVREGDRANIEGRLSNTSSQTVSGTAHIELLDPETEKPVYAESSRYTIAPEGIAVVNFALDLTAQSALTQKISGFDHSLLICRMTVAGKDYSDGEQHYLPVLPDREYVSRSLAFTQNEPGRKTIDLASLFPSNTTDKKLTVEYTNQPSWLMIQSLPSIAIPDNDNAVSLAAAYYANGIAAYLMNKNPELKRIVELWKKESPKTSTLMSQLDQDQDLKQIVLSETPWVLEADKQTDQKQKLCELLDENLIQSRRDEILSKLRRLQSSDGSWAWWQGMSGNIHMTEMVSEALVRLNAMTGKQQETAEMLSQAFKWMSGKMHEEVLQLRKEQSKGEKDVLPSEEALRYLYISAIDGRTLSSQGETDKNYLVNLIVDHGSALTIYGKAKTAIILAKQHHLQKAKEYLQSVKEYSVYTDEMGRYFDTHKAAYSWCDYKIPTEVAAIEGLRMIEPGSGAIDEMRRWLLQEKRTTSWDTPANAVDAVYAFGVDSLIPEGKESLSVLKIDGKQLETSPATGGLGYVKSSEAVKDVKTLTVDKVSTGTSWGAVYAQFMQKGTEVQGNQSGMTLERELLSASGSKLDPGDLKVGDRVTVRLTVTCDRDYDFVQLSDQRPACFEPVRQLSGYAGDYYYAPKDQTTNYFFDNLSKGKHVLQTEYVVDRTGNYQSGTCTVQCAYSPAYGARVAAQTYMVK